MASSVMQLRFVFFDLECGGLNPRRHPIIQIAAIAVDSDLSPVEAFEAKVQFDERDAKRDSLRKNHYNRGRWAKEAIEPFDAARSYADFLRRHATYPRLGTDGSTYEVAQLVAHNASFDGDFLRLWYEKLGVYLPARYQVLCTLQRAQWYFSENPSLPPPSNFKLATLCQYFRIPFHAASAHDALGDVTATVALYRALVRMEASKLGKPNPTPPATSRGEIISASDGFEGPNGVRLEVKTTT
jgi:DNA polymerase III epsilon subunit-like protein